MRVSNKPKFARGKRMASRSALKSGGLELGTVDVTRVSISAPADGEVKMVDSTATGPVVMSNVHIKHNVSAVVTATTTLTPAHSVVQVNSTEGAITITLPASNSAMAGRTLLIMDTGGAAATNFITITRAGSDTIHGQVNLVINSNHTMVALHSNGAGKWFANVSVS